MPFQINMRGTKVLYKCFGCLKIKNPITDKMTVIQVIQAMVPSDAGRVEAQLGITHLCPKCFKKAERRGILAEAKELDPNYGMPQQQKPKAIIDQSTQIPRPPGRRDNRPRRPGGKLSLN